MLRPLLLAVAVSSTVLAEPEKISDCLRNCITPLAKLERSFHYIFNNFEKVCDELETGAFCVRKCEQEDQNKFHQYTTFYRIHCIDYEEDIEPHLSCLSTAAKDAESICKDKCKNAGKSEKTANKEQKDKHACLSLECSTVCHFQEFTNNCPEAKEALLKLNIGQIHSIANTIHPVSFDRMPNECRNVHDTSYMKKAMLTE